MRALSLILALGLDAALGDPRWMPHPVVLFGKSISLFLKFFEPRLKTSKSKRMTGIALAFSLPVLTFFTTCALLVLLSKIHIVLAFIAETILIYQAIAARELYLQSMAVFTELSRGDLGKARYQLSLIVGRDTDSLDDSDVIKATVETVAENTSDGVIAPLLCALIGGAPLALAYKSINTLDSMVGYKNERFYDLGWASAKLDDLINFIPARVSAAALLLSCLFLGPQFRNAWKIFKRDRNAHSSPNAGQTESVVAGSLGISLGGAHQYGGVMILKPEIGDDSSKPQVSDIKKCNILMITATIVATTFSTFIAVCFEVLNAT